MAASRLYEGQSIREQEHVLLDIHSDLISYSALDICLKKLLLPTVNGYTKNQQNYYVKYFLFMLLFSL